VSPCALLSDPEVRGIARVVQVNLFGQVRGIEAPIALAQGSGAIIAVNPGPGAPAVPLHVSYCASKRPVVGLVEGLGMEEEHGDTAIVLIVVLPSSIGMPLFDHVACVMSVLTEPPAAGALAAGTCVLGSSGYSSGMRTGPAVGTYVARGIVAGVAGTVVMTAFQKFVEMPITKREESYAPANFAQKITGIDPKTSDGRRRLNYVTHFSLGMMWGTAYGLTAWKGLRGQKAVNAVFAVVYTGDVILNTALGLYHPSQWSGKELAIDLVDKYVQAQGTGAVFDRLLDPASQ
jgi:hypothetical protein